MDVHISYFLSLGERFEKLVILLEMLLGFFLPGIDQELIQFPPIKLLLRDGYI